jgi:hypothetical protein
LEADVLAIDPSILKTENGYFITITTIQGTVNNDNEGNDNGVYSVKLYYSKDLTLGIC